MGDKNYLQNFSVERSHWKRRGCYCNGCAGKCIATSHTARNNVRVRHVGNFCAVCTFMSVPGSGVPVSQFSAPTPPPPLTVSSRVASYRATYSWFQFITSSLHSVAYRNDASWHTSPHWLLSHSSDGLVVWIAWIKISIGVVCSLMRPFQPSIDDKASKTSNRQHISVCIYRVIQEEMSVFWEAIVWVIVRKKVYMNVCLILNCYRDRVVFESINTKGLWMVIRKRN
jgi:hypothetical protein